MFPLFTAFIFFLFEKQGLCSVTIGLHKVYNQFAHIRTKKVRRVLALVQTVSNFR